MHDVLNTRLNSLAHLSIPCAERKEGTYPAHSDEETAVPSIAAVQCSSLAAAVLDSSFVVVWLWVDTMLKSSGIKRCLEISKVGNTPSHVLFLTFNLLLFFYYFLYRPLYRSRQ